MQYVVIALIVGLGLSMVIAGATGAGGAGLFNAITGKKAKNTGAADFHGTGQMIGPQTSDSGGTGMAVNQMLGASGYQV